MKIYTLIFLSVTWVFQDLHAEEVSKDSSTPILQQTSIESILSERHFNTNIGDLISSFGEDKLVSSLIEIRLSELPPHAAIRAEKLLLKLTDRQDVRDLLLLDVTNPSKLGLASVILSNLNEIPNLEFREAIVNAASAKAREKSSSAYATRVRVLLAE